jgi:hypothetical protein
VKRVLRRPRESPVERAVVAYARGRGLVALKLTAGGGYPDRVFFGPDGEHLFMEFKREGGEPGPRQRHRIAELEMLGHTVYTVDDSIEGIRLLKKYYFLRGTPRVGPRR